MQEAQLSFFLPQSSTGKFKSPIKKAALLACPLPLDSLGSGFGDYVISILSSNEGQNYRIMIRLAATMRINNSSFASERIAQLKGGKGGRGRGSPTKANENQQLQPITCEASSLRGGGEPHQGMLEPECAGQMLPVLDAEDEFEPLKQVVLDGAVVELKEFFTHFRRGGSQAQHERALYLLKRLLLELRTLQSAKSA